ncbi:hypothetical protein EIK77_005512 [Talaromyces pinophilus]|uniref:Uncharacterized protein n=1 Tax=Talaromyces pinophilus TaxID=128442 RepID=A0A6V8HDL5_TALPI|nr:hypothetical protein EIK77_005512 [Talaromyces pinophilus]PCG98048.1 hypothetical protein PENOC_065020 [Penicillium occitanis (nom. inval.)]PCH05748.1 Hypothetical protein PENO1_020650 [Penicillium occitanis (nom. inval.)]GAM39582.1 hypothetical protein TCE0_034f11248 [Talaromyces pinophilus]
MIYSVLPMGEITYPRYPEDPPYARIRPEWLEDIEITNVQFWLQPGVPDIKFYLEIEQPIDIQNARYVLGVRAFQNVSAIETMLEWVGIEGKIREKVLKNWYQRVAKMQIEIEEERPAMPSLALPYDLGRHEEEDAYDSEKDGEYEIDEEYYASLGVAGINPNNGPTTTNNNINTSTTNHREVHQIQIDQYNNDDDDNEIIKPATVAHNFWPLFNRMCIRDLNFFRLQMDELCPHISEQINWAFVLCEPCTDVSAMIFLYVASVWHSRPVGKEDELAGPLIWSLAMQLRIIVPSEQILRVVEHTKATDQIPGLLPISQWR